MDRKKHHEQLVDVSTAWERICDALPNKHLVELVKKAKPLSVQDDNDTYDSIFCLGMVDVLFSTKQEWEQAYEHVPLHTTLNEVVGDAIYEITGYDVCVRYVFESSI